MSDSPGDFPTPGTPIGESNYTPNERSPFEYISSLCAAGPEVDTDILPDEFPLCDDDPVFVEAEVVSQADPSELIPPGDYCIERIEDYIFVTDEESLAEHEVGELQPRTGTERYTVDGTANFDGTKVRNVSLDPCAPAFEGDIKLDLNLDIPCIGFEISKGKSNVELLPIPDPVWKHDIVQGNVQADLATPNTDVCNLAYDFDLEIPCIGFEINKATTTITDNTSLEEPTVTLNIVQGVVDGEDVVESDEVCEMAYNLNIKLPPYLKEQDLDNIDFGSERILGMSVEQVDCSTHDVVEAVIDPVTGSIEPKIDGRSWSALLVNGAPREGIDAIDIVEAASNVEGEVDTFGICASRTAYAKITARTEGVGTWLLDCEEVVHNGVPSGYRIWSTSTPLGQVESPEPLPLNTIILIFQPQEFCGVWRTADRSTTYYMYVLNSEEVPQPNAPGSYTGNVYTRPSISVANLAWGPVTATTVPYRETILRTGFYAFKFDGDGAVTGWLEIGSDTSRYYAIIGEHQGNQIYTADVYRSPLYAGHEIVASGVDLLVYNVDYGHVLEDTKLTCYQASTTNAAGYIAEAATWQQEL